MRIAAETAVLDTKKVSTVYEGGLARLIHLRGGQRKVAANSCGASARQETGSPIIEEGGTQLR
ncbi:hypothetical protein AB0I10_37930 [Streptomyces sp. NPDC050636]|uniref:hypothetical protein n=1 Tax=Streptomyces sp. NPDC050636 TaxID=3154510 RepID=UPI0034463CFA